MRVASAQQIGTQQGCHGIPRMVTKIRLAAPHRSARGIVRAAAGNQAPGDSGKLRLIMLRHADSQELREVRDHDRPITDRGRAAAQQLAALLAERGWLPDVIVCSSAARTRQTLEAMAGAAAEFGAARAQYLASLYAVTALDGHTQKHLCECVLGADGVDGATCVMCVAHNKGLEEAASSFAGVPVRLQSANAALLEADVGPGGCWGDALADGARWRLVDVVAPPASSGSA